MALEQELLMLALGLLVLAVLIFDLRLDINEGMNEKNEKEQKFKLY